MTPAEFIAKIAPAAQASHKASGIPASFTLAQAALESGWGARATGCNLFGIKAEKSWTGPFTMFSTHEVINGVRIPVMAKFRLYATWDECLADRVNFFKKNNRYASCFLETTGEGWARAVAKAGYATDPNYANLIISIIEGRDLTKYDNLGA